MNTSIKKKLGWSVIGIIGLAWFGYMTYVMGQIANGGLGYIIFAASVIIVSIFVAFLKWAFED